MEKRTVSEIKEAMEKKGYAFFENGAYNINIIGERSANTDANHFDDTMHVVYRKEKDSDLVVETFSITTDAGSHWLKHPLNKNGCAILVPNQYKSSYKIGLHQNKYEALCQIGKVSVYRDNDRDNELDFDPESIQDGWFGINIHRSNPYSESYYVDKWSAGCQVFKKIDDYNHFMDVCRKSASIYGNKFTYTLLTYKDFE